MENKQFCTHHSSLITHHCPEAHALRAAFLCKVRHDLVAEVFERRGDRQWRGLAEATDRGELHGFGQFADQLDLFTLRLTAGGAVENLHNLVTPDPTGDTL